MVEYKNCNEILYTDYKRYYEARKQFHNILLIDKVNYEKDIFFLIINNKESVKNSFYQSININEKIDKSIFKNKKIFIIIDGNCLINKKYLEPFDNLIKEGINSSSKVKTKKIYTKHKNKKITEVFNYIKKIYETGTKYNVDFSYKNKLLGIVNHSSIPNSILNDLSYLVKVVTIKDKQEKYSYIYDVASDILDEDFKIFNHCDFQDAKCINICILNKQENNIYGCCFTKGEICKYLKNNNCSIKSLPCKLFICRYLKKTRKCLRINDILILKLFFNQRQKHILNMNIYQTKEEIIKDLLKN